MEVSLNNVKICFQDEGNRSGLPVVFIHAFPLSQQMWENQKEVLKREYRVITYDLRGFGKSGVGDGQYTIDLFVDDLIGMLSFQGIQKAVLCGLSMGGYIALRAKERFPERVRALILADTRFESDSDEAKIKRAEAIQKIKSEGISIFADGFVNNVFSPTTLKENPAVVESTRQMINANQPLGVCGALLAMAARTDTGRALIDAPVPTLILVGEEDKLTPVANSQLMHEKCKGSQLKVIKHAGHLSNLENVSEFNDALVNFLSLLNTP